MLVVSHQPSEAFNLVLALTMWERRIFSCTHGVGDSKSSRHMLPQMKKTGDPGQHSHLLSVRSFHSPLCYLHPSIFDPEILLTDIGGGIY